MITNWEELGEILAEFENRLSSLENSQHFHEPEEYSEIETLTPEPEFVKRQWDIVNQLRGEMRFLSSKIIELRAKKSEQRRYNIYT